MTIFKKIKNQVAENKLLDATQTMLNSGISGEDENQVIEIQRRIRANEANKHNSTISEEFIDREEKKIARAILFYADLFGNDLEKLTENPPKQAEEITNSEIEPKPEKSEPNFAWIGVIVIIALFIWILFANQEIPTEPTISQTIDNEYVPNISWTKSMTWKF